MPVFLLPMPVQQKPRQLGRQLTRCRGRTWSLDLFRLQEKKTGAGSEVWAWALS